MSTRVLLAGHIVADSIAVSEGVLGVSEEGTSVGTFSTLNFVGSSVTATEIDGVATITVVAGAAPTLTSVLTAGNDGGGLDVVNIGTLTFDTATATKGIAIGTDVASATSTHALSIAIGPDATVDSKGSVAIGNNVDATGSWYGIVIGYNSTLSGSRGISIGSSNFQTGGQYNVTIGYDCTAGTGDYNIVMGSDNNVFTSGQRNILLGLSSNITGSYNVCIGSNVSVAASGTKCVVIGDHSKSVAGSGNISIGNYAYNIGTGAANNNIVMGNYAICQGVATTKAISIGDHSTAAHSNAIVIGSDMTSSAINELTLGTTATHFRTAFVLDATAPSAGSVVLPNAVTMWAVTVNGVDYYMPLFTPPP